VDSLQPLTMLCTSPTPDVTQEADARHARPPCLKPSTRNATIFPYVARISCGIPNKLNEIIKQTTRYVDESAQYRIAHFSVPRISFGHPHSQFLELALPRPKRTSQKRRIQSEQSSITQSRLRNFPRRQHQPRQERDRH
jgi:hypothetical protein